MKTASDSSDLDGAASAGNRLTFIALGQTSRWAKAREASSGGNSAAKIFFFRVRRKEKTPNQYAKIINVYANESLNQENKENKRNKMIFNGHVLKHANRQHTTRDKHQKQIIVL